MLAGKAHRYGTKAHLRDHLLQLGWDMDEVDPVLSGKYQARNHLADVATEQHGTDLGPALTKLLERLKDSYQVTTLPKTAKATPLWSTETWDSYTRHPWWLAASGGARAVVLVTSSSVVAARGSASFVYDLWSNLRVGPELWMPTIRRLNLLSWASTDGLRRFSETVMPTTDLAVVNGGLLDPDHVYETLSYLSALGEALPGLVLYEAVKPESLDTGTLLTAARRARLSTVFELAGGGHV